MRRRAGGWPRYRRATFDRITVPDHVCPFGVRARELLRQAGYADDDRTLTTSAAVDALKAELRIETTPQIFIDEAHIGGSDALEAYRAIAQASVASVRRRH